MNWLKTIYNGLITEIRAEDAYNRFYNKMPKEDFYSILGGKEDVDKFYRFFLDCVRDGKSETSDAINAISDFKESDQLVKQSVLNKINTNAYEDCDSVIADIDYLSCGGAILSKNKFAKQGYFKIKEDDKWVATCTTNYLANGHYFGNSHWCTASDREGRFDGYHYFKRYTINDNGILIQFSWKGEIEPAPRDANGKVSEDYLDFDFPIEDIFKDGKILERFSLIQVQVKEVYEKTLTNEQICDKYDQPLSNKKFENIIGNDMFSVTEDFEVYLFASGKQNEQKDAEAKYQSFQDPIIQKRKERRRAIFLKKRQELSSECKEYNRNAEKEAREYWSEFLISEKYKDQNILQAVIDKYYTENSENSNRVLQEATDAMGTDEPTLRFLCISENIALNEGVKMTSIGPGYSPKVVRNFDRNGREDCEIADYGKESIQSEQQIFILRKEAKIINMLGLGVSNSAFLPDGSCRRGFCVFSKDREKKVVCHAKTNSVNIINGEVSDNLFIHKYINGKYIINTAGFPISKEYYIFDEKDGSVEEGDKNSYVHADFNFFTYSTDGETYLNVPQIEFYDFKLPPEQSEIEDVDIFDFNDFNVIRLFLKNGENAINTKKRDVIFGFNGRRLACSQTNDGMSCSMHFYAKNASFDITYYFPEDRYELKKIFKDGGYDTAPCDKYGVTENDKMAKKNFAKWKEQGGHSPEVKAQMDKMWDDHYHTGEGAAQTFKDWNDDDRKLDDTGETFVYDPNTTFNTALQKFDNDDRWRNRIGIKDPEGWSNSISKAIKNGNVGDILNGEIPDYMRKNPWYRIGKDGKPLDQPWYDEDEIPANLSDRVIHRNRVNEEFNKMKSIWDRMGLNDL